MKHPHPQIALLRSRGWSWDAIIHALRLDVSAETLRGAHSRWARNNTQDGCPEPDDGGDPVCSEEDGDLVQTRLLTREDISRITSLEDALTFFKVDLERWEPKSFDVNKWEMGSKDRDGTVTVTPLYQVKVRLQARTEYLAAQAAETLRAVVDDMKVHAPVYTPVERAQRLPGSGVLMEVDIFDPHLGMKAHGEEVDGKNYDLSIGVRDYTRAAEQLLALGRLYDTARILYVVGNDFLHVDWMDRGRGGTTTAGTPQDVDGRLHKLFTAGRRALVSAIDQARLIAPVDVLVVPGNHDAQSMYRMGEVLNAWYRHDPEVCVIYGPNKRFFYGFGANAFMFTHGEEYGRKRDNLPLIMLDECPIDFLAASKGGVREIHTGHNHARKAGGYYPEAELTESRGVVTRSLPGLTPSDSWHYLSGYRHRRAATAFLWHHSGGLAGHHEVHF